MKVKILLICSVLLLIVSLAVGLYPSISNYINSKFCESTIDNYSQKVDTLDTASKDEMIHEAEDYNDQLKNLDNDFSYSIYSNVIGYDDVLDFNDGVIGYIEIPTINVHLPIYHGSGEDILSKGAAHLPNTAFPVGGIGNHCVLAAHTGYVGKIFFDDIDKLKTGDMVYIKILDYTFAYKVFERHIVEPSDISPCQVVRDKDLLSLVTCHPYGQNTHRLIVTAERDESAETVNTVTADSDTHKKI